MERNRSNAPQFRKGVLNTSFYPNIYPYEQQKDVKIPIAEGDLWRYRGRFNLDIKALKQDLINGERFLDCPSGRASFSYDLAERMKKGGYDFLQPKGSVFAVDLAYGNLDNLPKSFRAFPTYEVIHSPAKYCPTYAADITHLPFSENFFKASFCSYLPFSYPELGEDFHFDAIKELVRVTREKIYIYPLCNHYVQGEGKHAALNGPTLNAINGIDEPAMWRRNVIAYNISYLSDIVLEKLSEPNSSVRPEVYKINDLSVIASNRRVNQPGYHYGIILHKKQS